ncbi:MAG: family transposase [Phycisphaerales bacterium]|nr:family transposase [Phycisphaerales bacterium]
MTFDDYLLHPSYLVNTEYEALHLDRLRRRGPAPALRDSEVLTMELAGEFLGLDTDKAIYRFFRRYHRAEFPALARVHRTTFARRAVGLWRVAQLLHERLVGLLPLRYAVSGEPHWLVDSFPLHVCRYARAKGSKLFKGNAAYGHDHVVRNTFFGFRVHVRCSDCGPVAQVELTPADVSDPAAAAALVPPGGGVGNGDRAYWGPDRQAELARAGLLPLAPYRNKRKDPAPQRSKLLTRFRRTIETMIGQFAERFRAKRTWARDLWHLCHRLGSKVLSHTAAMVLNHHADNPPLQFDLLITELTRTWRYL